MDPLKGRALVVILCADDVYSRCEETDEWSHGCIPHATQIWTWDAGECQLPPDVEIYTFIANNAFWQARTSKKRFKGAVDALLGALF